VLIKENDIQIKEGLGEFETLKLKFENWDFEKVRNWCISSLGRQSLA